jgi:DNA-binding PadR family transcriptional regulator
MGRLFEHGDLRLVAPQLIAEKPRHGYEIIKAIEEQSSGGYTPSAGAVYLTLTLLQELGQLTVKDGEDGCKLYAITEEGKAGLFANRKDSVPRGSLIASVNGFQISLVRLKVLFEVNAT